MSEDPSNVFFKHIPQAPTRKSRLATASFVLANLMLLGLLLAFAHWSFAVLGLLCIPAVITGHLARRAIRKDPHTFTNPGMATFGIAVGYFGIALNVFAIAAVVAQIRAGN